MHVGDIQHKGMKVTLNINQHLLPQFMGTLRSTASWLLVSFTLKDEAAAQIL